MDPNHAPELKRCTTCNETKEVGQFPKRKNGRPRSPCKQCATERIRRYQRGNPAKTYAAQLRWKAKNPERTRQISRDFARKWRSENPEEARERDFRSDLKKHYGVTPEWYRETLASQGGVCAVCGNPPGQKRLAVDHCHDSLRVRGLLCSQCNTALHKMERDIEWFRKAEAYLHKHGAMG